MDYYRSVLIRIEYISGLGVKGENSGIFPLRGRRPEEVAFDFLRQLRKELYKLEMFRVTLEDTEDITDKVRQLDVIPTDNLPF
ncbi:hypothetical protein [Bacillus sp. B-jedd]|uniref:hypothetical protein n=1 Tax=Bacillus sp. B-jedd TaxID=1476857 RepID=UPI0005156015|nr:hypothetical protein [Bacillus sp. B-jedd]CEG26026.1 hypothetical protein BN1002_00864 [Bacillus sp. B-jedd]